MTTRKRAIIIASVLLAIIIVAVLGMYMVSRRASVKSGAEPLSFKAFIGLGDRTGTGTGQNGTLLPGFNDGTDGGLGNNPGTTTPDGSNGAIGGESGTNGTGTTSGGRYNGDGSINTNISSGNAGGKSSIFTNQAINLGNGGSIGTGTYSGSGTSGNGTIGGSIGGGAGSGSVIGGIIGGGTNNGNGDNGNGATNGGGTDGNGGTNGGGGSDNGGGANNGGSTNTNPGLIDVISIDPNNGGAYTPPDDGNVSPGKPDTGTLTPTADTSLASDCTSADVTIAFTADEIELLNALQERFYAIAQTLHTDGDVKVELANYDNFKLKLDKLRELNNYCQSKAPLIPSNYPTKRVPTPFWYDPKINNQPVSTTVFGQIFKQGDRVRLNYNPANIDTFLDYRDAGSDRGVWDLGKSMIEIPLRINLW